MSKFSSGTKMLYRMNGCRSISPVLNLPFPVSLIQWLQPLEETTWRNAFHLGAHVPASPSHREDSWAPLKQQRSKEMKWGKMTHQPARVSNKARKWPRVSLPSALPSWLGANSPCQPPTLLYHLLLFKWQRLQEKAPSPQPCGLPMT